MAYVNPKILQGELKASDKQKIKKQSVQSKKKALQLSLKHPSDFFSPLLALLFGVFVAVLFGFGVLYLLRNS